MWGSPEYDLCLLVVIAALVAAISIGSAQPCPFLSGWPKLFWP
jgi:hypothetical protein